LRGLQLYAGRGWSREEAFLTGVDLPAGMLISGSLYQATRRAVSGEWLLQSFPASGLVVPIGGIIDYAGTIAPNPCFVFPNGVGLNTTTYAQLFALIGYTYGSAGATFNVPDLTGRVSVMKEATATRLTTAGNGIDGGTLGAPGGGQNATLLTANLPAQTLQPGKRRGSTHRNLAYCGTCIGVPERHAPEARRRDRRKTSS
jgi:hypothetical protein